MKQMQVVADCCPIPGVVNGVNQSNLIGREYIITAPKRSHGHKKQKPRAVEIIDFISVVVEKEDGTQNKISAVRVKINGTDPFYPASAFTHI